MGFALLVDTVCDEMCRVALAENGKGFVVSGLLDQAVSCEVSA